jgi:hypothetical protein
MLMVQLPGEMTSAGRTVAAGADFFLEKNREDGYIATGILNFPVEQQNDTDMIEFALIILMLPIFVFLWKFIEKGPALFAKMADLLQKQNSMAAWLNSLLLFSATTPDNREAEFIDEPLPEQRKLIRLLRALLIIGFLLFAVYWLKK